MNEYLPTIGLEIHAELRTNTKMFCASKNDPDEERPNVNVCPVCMAHPGSLPVINKEAVRQVLRVGTALKGTLADYTEFDRKNYFYPDLPKGYQLSQYEFPLVSGGELQGVAITRVHLEEDTARSVHDAAAHMTIIDYNRAGVPLMELVTEPVIHSAAQAGAFARELQLLLQYLGASGANMEKGEMRVEANVSVGTNGVLGTKVEIKNLNSFRAMERAVACEIERHTALLERGEQVIQETRGWDEQKQTTFSQRLKEGSADYRYFPDPDLPSLTLSEIPAFDGDVIARSLPELPYHKRDRYIAAGIKREDAELYVRESALSAFVDTIAQERALASDLLILASNYIANDLVKLMRDLAGPAGVFPEEVPISTKDFLAIIDLVASKKISSRGAKDLLALCVKEGGNPLQVAHDRGLLQEKDETALLSILDDLIAQHPKVAQDYRSGKAAALEFFVGKAMGVLQGAADPDALRRLAKERLA